MEHKGVIQHTPCVNTDGHFKEIAIIVSYTCTDTTDLTLLSEQVPSWEAKFCSIPAVCQSCILSNYICVPNWRKTGCSRPASFFPVN